MSNPAPTLLKQYTDACAQLGEVEYRLADLDQKKRVLLATIAKIQEAAALTATASVPSSATSQEQSNA